MFWEVKIFNVWWMTPESLHERLWRSSHNNVDLPQLDDVENERGLFQPFRSDPVHLSRGTGGIMRWFQRRRILRPTSPFWNHSTWEGRSLMSPETWERTDRYPFVSKDSGARYHLVEMYSVKGGLEYIPRHEPKSASFNLSSLIKIFSGLISLLTGYTCQVQCRFSINFNLWKMFCLCMKAIAVTSWNIYTRTCPSGRYCFRPRISS